MTHTPSETMQGTQAKNAWRLLLLLLLANLLNMYDRVIPAVLAESLRLEFNLTDLHLGLAGTIFTVVYALAGIPLGRIADTRSRVRLIALGLGGWSLFTALTGLTGGLIGFLLMRAGVGVGEASFAPAANSLIADVFPSRRRSRAVGIYMVGPAKFISTH